MPTKRRRTQDDATDLMYRRIVLEPQPDNAISLVVPATNVPDYPEGWGEHIAIPLPIVAHVSAGPETPWDLKITLDLGEDRRTVEVQSVLMTRVPGSPKITSGDFRGVALGHITRAILSRSAGRVFSKPAGPDKFTVTPVIAFETDEHGHVTAGMAPFHRPMSTTEHRAAMPPAKPATRANAVPLAEKLEAWRHYLELKSKGTTKDPMAVVGEALGWSRAKVGKVVAEARREGWT